MPLKPLWQMRGVGSSGSKFASACTQAKQSRRNSDEQERWESRARLRFKATPSTESAAQQTNATDGALPLRGRLHS